MTRAVYWVSPHDGGWAFKREGQDQPLQVFDTKQPTLDHARQTARNHQPSQVKIQREDGTIEDEWTYGADPHPPRG
jgi:hypothetical protein